MRKIWVNKIYISKQATKWTGIIFSIIGLGGTFISMSDVLPQTLNIGVRFLISIGILAFIWVSAFIIAALIFNGQKWVEVFEVPNNCHVYVQYGDVFSSEEVSTPQERRNIVIPVNRCFDTKIDDDLVSSRTLHGIAFNKIYSDGKYDQVSLNRAIQADLKKKGAECENITIADKRAGNLQRYSVGNVAELTVSPDCTYFFFALSKFNYDLKAETSNDEYVLGMMRLIEYFNDRSQGYPIVMPLIGAGLSRADKNERDILEFMVKLLKMNKNLIKSDVHIVVRNSGRESIAITDL